MSDIATRVKKIIVDKLGVEETEVTNEASFTNDLGADSLDTVELIMEFEKEFNISIPDEQAATITTVGQAGAKADLYLTLNFGASHQRKTKKYSCYPSLLQQIQISIIFTTSMAL